MDYRKMIAALLLAALCAMTAPGAGNAGGPAHAEPPVGAHDLLIINGRVIDPETGRDEVAAVAVKDGAIARIASGPGASGMEAKKTIDAEGRVVSPGFINTHTHEAGVAETLENITPVTMLLVHDGVTFWLGGNCGMSPTGVSVDLGEGSFMKRGDPDRPLSEFLDEAETVPLYNNYATLTGNMTLRSNMGLEHMENESPGQIEAMKEILARDLAAGSFGVSFGVMYDMGATKESMVEFARLCEREGGMAASHTRYPTFNLKHLSLGVDNVVLKRSINEAIDTCRLSGVPFIVSHITDMSQADSARWAFKTIDRAITDEGLPLAGDIIGHDYLGNDFFVLTGKGKLPVPFMMKLGNFDIGQFYAGRDVYMDGELFLEKYGQLGIEEAEHLRKNIERIDGVKEKGLPLICRIIPPEDTKLGLGYPWVFIGNDHAGPAISLETGEPEATMPRGLGTFSRLLGHWSRDEGALSLEEALFKATIAPALWLGLDKKGRLQEGCDADIVIFDPETINGRADWVGGKENEKPAGIDYVIVAGEVVVDHNELTGASPGRLVRRDWPIPGDTSEVLGLYEKRFGPR